MRMMKSQQVAQMTKTFVRCVRSLPSSVGNLRRAGDASTGLFFKTHMKIKWKQVPSVMTGGKPYFWHSLSAGAVVWDRIEKRWAARTVIGRIIGHFKNPAKAKKAIEQYLNNKEKI